MPHWLVSGFSPVGLLVVVLQQIPGIVWAIHPPKVDPFAHNSGTPLIEVLEKGFGVTTLVLLVVVFARVPVPAPLAVLCLVASFVVLAAYYVLYVLYYRGVTQLPVLLGMAIFPPLCFALLAVYQGNWPAIITAVGFGVVHVSLTYRNLGRGTNRDSQQAAQPS